MVSKEIKFLLTHSSIYGLGTVVSQVVAFVLLPLYTRYLTPADYGVLSAIELTTGIIGMFVTVGIARALSRFFYESDSETERNKILSTTYITYALIACLAAPLLILSSGLVARLLFSSEVYGGLIRISFITLMLGGIVDIGMMYLRLIKKPVVYISVTMTRMVFSIVLNVYFIVFLGMGISGVFYSSLIVICIYAIFITVFILMKTKISFSLSISRQLVAYGFPLIISGLGNTVVKQSDKYFVLYFISIADMGIYSLALKIGNAIHTLLTIPFNMAYIPRRFEIMNRADARHIYGRIFTYYVFLVVYIGLFLSILIPEILGIMVTPGFYRAAEIIPLVVLSMIIFGTHYHFDFGILHSKKTKYLSYISFICAAVQISLNYALIPGFGFFGAVWSSIISLGLQAVMLYVISQKYFPVQYEFGRIVKYMLIAFVFYGISTKVQSSVLLINVSIKLLLLTLFPAVVLLLKVISQGEREEIKKIYMDKVRPLLSRKIAAKAN